MKKQRKQAEQDANLLDGRLRCLRLRVMIEIKKRIIILLLLLLFIYCLVKKMRNLK